MIRHIRREELGRAREGWLDSHFHFSFADYCNPDRVAFGVLRVLNDDIVQPGTGFGTHPHANMEILSYVVEGELTHADSMGNQRTLVRGQVQYMSAGSGVEHSEFNLSREPLRFLQIWFIPSRRGLPPAYGDVRFAFADRENGWLHIASGVDGRDAAAAPVRMHADVNVFAAALAAGNGLEFAVLPGRQAYLALIEGGADVNGVKLRMRDAMEITEESIAITADPPAHALLIEMAKP